MRTKILLVSSALLVIAAIAMDFLIIPSKTGSTLMQHNPIFYLHIPVSWIALTGFLIVFIAGIAYLRTRRIFWDMIGSTAAELGLIFTTFLLLTGSIWGKAEWGIWWDWDARLTSSLVLWIIYMGYFLLRAYITEPGQRARYSAVFGIIGFIDVPIVILSLFVSRRIHPGGEAFKLSEPGMIITLVMGVVAFSLLFLALMIFRLRLKEDAQEIAKLKELKGEE